MEAPKEWKGTPEQWNGVIEAFENLVVAIKEVFKPIVKKATSGGYKTFYPIKKFVGKKTTSATSAKKKSSFSNFEERSYDMDELERQLLRQQGGIEKS